MILVAITVIAAAAAGVLFDHRTDHGGLVARSCLSAMLYVLMPVVSYVSFARLHLSAGGGAGLVIAYGGLGLGGFTVWSIVRRRGLPRESVGAAILTVIMVNTGYLGFPMTLALLGARELPHAVAYDQLINGPMLFIAGFPVGAAFGHIGRSDRPDRSGRFTTRDLLSRLVLRNPPLLAAVAGLLVPPSWAPQSLVDVSHVIVDALLVIGFFAVGVYLSAERREDGAPLLERPDGTVLSAMLVRFTVNPALLGLAALIGVGIPRAYLLQALMPTGIASLIVGHACRLDQRLIATVIVWDTMVVLAVGLVVYLS